MILKPVSLHTSRTIGFTAWVLAALLGGNPALAQDNGGLGPLSVRSLFPPMLPYLAFSPEVPTTLSQGKQRFFYQYALGNTFINTQAPGHGAAPEITSTQVARGLTLADFPSTGYRAYIDMEVERHQFSYRLGVVESLELGVDLAWVTLGGGKLDGSIESFERPFGGLNLDRTHSQRNRFDYYLTQNGQFLVNTSQGASKVPQDPVFRIKWNWWEGGDVTPAVSVLFLAKHALVPQPGPVRSLASSGYGDYGYYMLISKQIDSVVAHIQFGTTQLGDNRGRFNQQLWNQIFGLEFRSDPENSWLVQIETRSSQFKDEIQGTSGDIQFLSRPSDVLMLGHKFHGDTWLFDIGLVEDYNQSQNETDIVLFTTIGWEW